ncbi:universal stress protein [Deinococcus humi]|uniref:Nucleotide-binding universal stress UspA family protein n=1 Tax=Deinococcus humi TaxID=662880 RepID=A0A7W8NG87_9DEIO|nr:universal stress protein [Deinococcus humi]MBB5364560.1 nucleotide-binding universal stress UspA family protein [Deinococcus humi]GGO38179.1 universal stress protein [Deinococcus humi]
MTEPAPALYQRLLVATGGAPHSLVAIERAATLAEHFGATLHVVTVIPQGNQGLENVTVAFGGSGGLALQENHERFESHLRETASALRTRGLQVEEHLLRALRPADAILAVAAEVGVDLILLGRRHKTAWSAALAGSVSDMVSHASPVDVLIVR